MWLAQVCPNISPVSDCTVYSWSMLERSQTVHERCSIHHSKQLLQTFEIDELRYPQSFLYIFISYHLLHQLCPNYVNVCFTKSPVQLLYCSVLRRVMPQQDGPRHMSSAASSAGASASAASSAAGACYLRFHQNASLKCHCTRIHLHKISWT